MMGLSTAGIATVYQLHCSAVHAAAVHALPQMSRPTCVVGPVTHADSLVEEEASLALVVGSGAQGIAPVVCSASRGGGGRA